VVFEFELAPLLATPPINAHGISKFPAVRRDIALIVDENVSAESVLEVLREAAPPFVGEIQLFDVYHGQNLPVGKKSLAILVLMQDTQRTLTDAEVDAAQAVMVSRAQERFRASLRH
jgi:phenylalanyl-tRNA synthetase beta chain